MYYCLMISIYMASCLFHTGNVRNKCVVFTVHTYKPLWDVAITVIRAFILVSAGGLYPMGRMSFWKSSE